MYTIKVISVFVAIAVAGFFGFPFAVGTIKDLQEKALLKDGQVIEAGLQAVLDDCAEHGIKAEWDGENGASAVGEGSALTICEAVRQKTGEACETYQLNHISSVNGKLDTFAFEKGGKTVYFDATPASGLKTYTVVPAPTRIDGS